MYKKPKIEVDDFEALFGGASDEIHVVERNFTKNNYPIEEIPISELHAFKEHPFKVVHDDAMDDFAESVKRYGVMHPGLVRKDPAGGYEIISGHRRHFACILAGLETMPARVLELDDDEATICMADANFYQREVILYSEKAKAYRKKYDAMKHQGCQQGGNTLDKMGEAAGESGKTVQRFIRLSYLTDEMLDLVDEKKIPLLQAVELSHIEIEKQEIICEAIKQHNKIVSLEQAVKIRELAEKGNIIVEQIQILLMDKKIKERKVVLKPKFLNQYFVNQETEKEIEEVVSIALEEYFARREK